MTTVLRAARWVWPWIWDESDWKWRNPCPMWFIICWHGFVVCYACYITLWYAMLLCELERYPRVIKYGNKFLINNAQTPPWGFPIYGATRHVGPKGQLRPSCPGRKAIPWCSAAAPCTSSRAPQPWQTWYMTFYSIITDYIALYCTKFIAYHYNIV